MKQAKQQSYLNSLPKHIQNLCDYNTFTWDNIFEGPEADTGIIGKLHKP